MKRKAMLMGMAVMTGLPGWAMAKGELKPAAGSHYYADAMEASSAEPKVELQPLPDADRPIVTTSKAAELLANIKSMLRQTNYGMVAQRAVDNQGWRLEMLEGSAWAYSNDDVRRLQSKPVGVGVRFKF